MLVTTILFGLNEANCKDNHIVIHNELAPNVDLEIACRFGSQAVKPYILHTLKFKAPYYVIPFRESKGKHTKCYCVLSHGKKPEETF